MYNDHSLRIHKMESTEPHGRDKMRLMPRPSVPTFQKCHGGPKGANGEAHFEWCHYTFHLRLTEALHPSFH